MDKFNERIIITGGAGFIGSHVVRHFVKKYPASLIVCLDKLTYCGNLRNLEEIEDAENYRFEKCDITDYQRLSDVFDRYNPTGIIHLAAESHVDRSISDPGVFAATNVMGTLNLLNLARERWGKDAEVEGKRFLHISTDEVFGALKPGDAPFCEKTPYSPHSPYSASKASSDHFVRAFHDTYGLPTMITNCSNNYGPNQFPEKLIPLFINNIVEGRPLPVYGKGENIRDWLFVGDHVSAIDLVFHEGRPGRTYCIGGNNELRNIDLVHALIAEVDRQLGREPGASEHLISYVTDRAGHDLRYAIDNIRIREELGWEPAHTWEEGLRTTVQWYLDNKPWMEEITSGEYRDYYDRQYSNR